MLQSSSKGSTEISMDDAFLKKVRDYIIKNISCEEFSLDRLAEELGYSRSQIHRKLVKIAGKPTSQYVREIRLEEALRLLRAQMGTVSEISYRVGFSSPAHFNRSFTKFFSITPGEILKRGKDDLTNDTFSIIPGKPALDKKPEANQLLNKKLSKISPFAFLHRHKNFTALNQRTWYIIAVVFIIACCGSIWLYLGKTLPSFDRAVIRSDIPLIGPLEGLESKAMAISPNGESLVYCMNGELNLVCVNRDNSSNPIPGTTSSENPFFSPDSKWIGFISLSSQASIMKIPLTGGNPIPICRPENGALQAIWFENDIIFTSSNAVYRVPETGGIPEKIYPPVGSDNSPVIWNPQMLPDKKTLLFSQKNEDYSWSILTWRLGSKESPAVLVERGRQGMYLTSGHIAYTLNNHLYICKFNPKTNRIISEPQIILTKPVFEYYQYGGGLAQFDFSDNGILVYYEQHEQRRLISKKHLVFVEESGAVTPPITSEAKGYEDAKISSDGQYIAASVESEVTNSKIEIIDTKTGNSYLFVEDANCPVWSSDNSYIYYVVGSNTTSKIFEKPVDRSTPPKLLFEIDSFHATELQNLSSDGRYLPFDSRNIIGIDYDIGYYDIVNSKVELLEHYNTSRNEYSIAISPDGKWLAYISDYSGQAAIYVAPFPGPGQTRRVTSSNTNNDIRSPVWASDMTALYYLTYNSDNELWKINVKASGKDISFEPAQSISINGDSRYVSINDIEIHLNGYRFLISKIDEDNEVIKIISNWDMELKER